MPGTSKQKWYAIPKDRIIDAAPIAAICILLVIPYAFPIAFSLLHVWLWLRHPRSRSRYLIAATVTLVYVLLTIGLAFVVDQMEIASYGFSSVRRQIRIFAPAIIGAIAAGGIFPILYRLISRNALAYLDDSRDLAKSQQSRGSIADILFLSICCAVTFVVLRMEDYDFDGLYSPRSTVDNISITLASSIAAVVALRLMSRVKGIAGVTRFIIASLLAMAIIYVALEFSRFASQAGYTFELPWEQRGGIDDVVALLLVFAIPLPIFAVIMRGCGVIVSRDGQVPKESKEPGSKVGRATFGLMGFLSRLFGGLVVAAIVGFFVFASGSTAAGFPLTYSARVEIPQQSFSRGGAVWESILFSWPALTVDAIVWFLVVLAIATPKFVSTRMSRTRLKRWRIGILVGAALLVVNTCYIKPQRKKRLKNLPGVERLSILNDHDSALESIFSELELAFRIRPRVARGRVAYVDFKDASEEVIQRVLSEPYVMNLSFDHCELSEDAIKPLAGSHCLMKLKIRECEVSKEAAEVIAGLPRLMELSIDSVSSAAFQSRSIESDRIEKFEVFANRDGPIFIPGGLSEAVVIAPDDEGRSIDIGGGQNVVDILLRNTTNVVPPSVCKVILSGLPSLERLQLDRFQRFNVTVRDAPKLRAVLESNEVRMPHTDAVIDASIPTETIARVTGLKLSNVPSIRSLLVDVSDCGADGFRLERDVQGGEESDWLYQLVVNGRTLGTKGKQGRISDEKLAGILGGLPEKTAVASVRIYGATVGAESMNALSQRCAVEELVLRDCDVDSEAFDQWEQMPEMTSLEAQAYSPSDAQFQHLIKQLPNLAKIDIEGSNILSIPSGLAPQGGVIRLANAAKLQSVAAETIQNVAVLLTLSREQYEYVNRYPDVSDGPMVWIQGDAIDALFLKHLVQRLADRKEGLDLCLISPSATAEDFRGIDWLSTESLTVSDARINDKTVASWKMLPSIGDLDLSRCDVTVSVLGSLLSKSVSPTMLSLREIKSGGRVPSGMNAMGGWILELRGTTITQQDLINLTSSDFSEINVHGSGLTDQVIEMVIEKTASGSIRYTDEQEEGMLGFETMR